ncbi:MAG: dihydroorotate dehydrogenase-like protein [Acidimicrobiia bacterium]|nr:dihydroorotate dehydrogenase-like protein [Acidimicrobiia bacterium]
MNDVRTDLSTDYLGLSLRNPLVASASPLTGSLDSLQALDEAGVGAVVLPSLFEEQVVHEAMIFGYHEADEASFNPEAHGGYFPAMDDYNTGADRYLDLMVSAKRELTVPVIASLNGTSEGGWTHYASALEGEGADAVELNIYHLAADPDQTAVEVEDRYLRLVEKVRSEISIPLAVKVGPFFSSPANMARRLAEAGADGLVLFNRFYQPDIDLETFDVAPDLELSTPVDMRLVLRWIAIMRGRVDAYLAATSGVHDGVGAVKMILVGADVVMMASALLRYGPDHVATVLADLGRWFDDRSYESVVQARGSMSQVSVPDPSAFERANYVKTISSYHPDV